MPIQRTKRPFVFRPRVLSGGTYAERFWSRVDMSGGPDACWLWTGALNHGGYGHCGSAGEGGSKLTHRIAWERTRGPIPDGLLVCHNCPGGDNRACCNPDHLWLGTPQDNMADRGAKGRTADNHRAMPGEAHPRAKLTDNDVRSIRWARARGIPVKELAEAYGIRACTVSQIANRKRWSHVK